MIILSFSDSYSVGRSNYYNFFFINKRLIETWIRIVILHLAVAQAYTNRQQYKAYHISICWIAMTLSIGSTKTIDHATMRTNLRTISFILTVCAFISSVVISTIIIITSICANRYRVHDHWCNVNTAVRCVWIWYWPSVSISRSWCSCVTCWSVRRWCVTCWWLAWCVTRVTCWTVTSRWVTSRRVTSRGSLTLNHFSYT